jgi:predicted glycogen debranching enzyme
VNSSIYEWLEPDGLGGFASGTSLHERTRRYHALLLSARKPPGDRRVLVNGVDAVVDVGDQRLALTSQTYRLSAQGEAKMVRHEGRPVPFTFDHTPWPTWTYDLGGGGYMEHSVLVPRGSSLVVLSWRLTKNPANAPVVLSVRPFLSGRDYHSLQRENADFSFKPEVDETSGCLSFQPYESEPAVIAAANGAFQEEAYWYRDFLYTEDRDRGLDCAEDLGAPGVFTFDLNTGEALLVLGTGAAAAHLNVASLNGRVAYVREIERKRRAHFTSALDRAGSAFVVERGHGQTVLAGYPWFTDWGRDTFIALRGLCLATGRVSEARRVLSEWSGAVSYGMLPNRFTDSDENPEFNSVDASLWFVVAVHDLRVAEKRSGFMASAVEEWQLNAAIVAILRGYASGARHGIRMDSDHLLAAGEPGVQLTWMDAKVGDYVVTPRIGKPVEIEALWINALRIGGLIDAQFAEWGRRAEEAFNARFWNEEAGYLYDVIDCDHVPGRVDAHIRPNAVFAVGGLPFDILKGDRARAVVDIAEAKLLTPAGLRSLSPDDPQYRGTYRGGVWARDTAYHQGTVWAFLMGPFVEAWVRTRGDSVEARQEARRRFLDPMLEVLDPHGTGQLPEIAEGDAPHAPRGCPFQAWSVGEALRLERSVLSPER